MPLFHEPKVLFVHIPKTGGTNIEQYFKIKYKTQLNTNSMYFINQEMNQHRKNVTNLKNELHKKTLNSINAQTEYRPKPGQIDWQTNLLQMMMILPPSVRPPIKSYQDTLKSLPEYKELLKMELVHNTDHSLQHFTWNELKQNRDVLEIDDTIFGGNSYNIITAVRNPYDRVMSDLMWNKITNRTMDANQVNIKLREYLESSSTYDNHKTPQYLYLVDEETGTIPPQIKILRTETLTAQMHSLGFRDFKQKNSPAINYMVYLNTDSIKRINEYYKKDFEMFGYPMIQAF